MEIEEMRKLKKEAEEEISLIVNNLHERTHLKPKVCINDIETTTVDDLCNGKRTYCFSTEITMEI